MHTDIRKNKCDVHSLMHQYHAAAALPPRKEPRYPLDRKLRRPQSRSGRCGEKKNLLPLPGIEPRQSSLSLH
jgi:hypothetical protein